MKKIITLLTLVIVLQINSQAKFEKGYFINNLGEKIECLIQNLDWKDNPSSFKYKIAASNTTEKITIDNVKEFELYNIVKFIKAKVNVDKSTDIISELDYQRKPKFKEETLFLRTLIEGEVNLFSYEKGKLKRFFFQKNKSQIEPLIYKQYKTQNNTVVKNKRFIQQIINQVKCISTSTTMVERLKYKTNSLVKYFIEFHECSNFNYRLIGIKINEEQKNEFYLTINPRLNSTSLSITDSSPIIGTIDFGTQTSFGLGIEAEMILPFNNKNWSISIEPTFQKLRADSRITINNGIERIVEVDFTSIELPVGLKRNFFFEDKSRLFLNFLASFAEIKFDRNVIFKTKNNDTVAKYRSLSGGKLAFGFGYRNTKKMNIEFRYQINNPVINSFDSAKSKSLIIIVGYTLF